MKTSRLCVGLSFAVLTLVSSCRTSTGGSSVQDEQTDLLRAGLPQGLVSFVVPSAELDKHVAPATGANGVPPTLNGVWWTDAKTIQFVVSFKHAVWNPKTRVASLVYLGPGTYVRQPNTKDTVPDRTAVGYKDFKEFTGYDIGFNESLDQATMLVAQTRGDERLSWHQDEGDFTLNFVEDGLWRRDTPGKDSYFLRRIIDANGKKEPAFDDFLKKFGSRAQVYKASLVLDEASPTLKVPLKAGQETYVSVKGSEEAWSRTGFVPYVVTFKSEAPFEVQSFGSSNWGSKQSSSEPLKFLGANSTSTDTFIVINSDRDGEAELTLSRGEAAQPIKLGENDVELKANVPSYFKIEGVQSGEDVAYRVKVQSDTPTDIMFRRLRSAGRAGQKENSLWFSSSRMGKLETFENSDTVTLKAKADSRAKVVVSKAEMKVKKYDRIKADGTWHEATLADPETIDVWPIDSDKGVVTVEIEELNKKKVPELYLMSTSEDLNYLRFVVDYGRFNSRSDPNPEQFFARKTTVYSENAALVHFGGNQQLQRSPKYRIRAL